MILLSILQQTSLWDMYSRYLYTEYEYEYEYEIFIALISQRNIRVQGSTSIKIYGYQHTTNKLKH